MKSLLTGALAVIAFLAVGCSTEESPAPTRRSILDQGTRFPSDEGVVTQVDLEGAKIELDGARSYRVSRQVESFTSRTHRVTALVHWKDRYVHVGLDDESVVVWVAGIGVVARDGERMVTFSGVFERVEKGRAVFRDGTALKVAAGVATPEPGKDVVCSVDPKTGEIVRILG